ncbi:protein-tyrosine phosphatase family protein [Changpingibacter yushuensis]|uniref:hypothetical protein n=1 Tax=Changpingibacter yushuensis TaxID=2758440 RepID=UPI00165E18AA|nr:hypothetical protein [Changpingibacter yushuensis]
MVTTAMVVLSSAHIVVRIRLTRWAGLLSALAPTRMLPITWDRCIRAIGMVLGARSQPAYADCPTSLPAVVLHALPQFWMDAVVLATFARFCSDYHGSPPKNW